MGLWGRQNKGRFRADRTRGTGRERIRAPGAAFPVEGETAAPPFDAGAEAVEAASAAQASRLLPARKVMCMCR